MIAMDVVDTLRHDQLIVERELNEDERKAKLIERLREIYSAQGIDWTASIAASAVAFLQNRSCWLSAFRDRSLWHKRWSRRPCYSIR